MRHDPQLYLCTVAIRIFHAFLLGAQLEPLLRDLAGLNLSKYLSEVATALTDVKLKINDVPAAVTLCSQIHCTYADFAPIFLEHWVKTLHPKKNADVASENISKLRVDLRFYGELVSTGVLPSKASCKNTS